MRFKKIISLNNLNIIKLKKLQQKKYRDKYNEFIIENYKIIFDAYKSGYLFTELYLTDEIYLKAKKLINKLDSNIQFFLINKKINKSFSNLDNPSGIAAVYKKNIENIDFKKSILYLNNIQDPGNVGTLIRSALAFNIKNIIIDKKCADIYNPKSLQASKDAVFKIKHKQITTPELNDIKKEMILIGAVSEGGDTLKPIKERPFCLILGNEAHGLDKDVIKVLNKKVTIPINPEIESLNVAAAGAIIMYRLAK